MARAGRWLCAVLVLASCESTPSTEIPTALEERLDRSLYAYFRFTNREFAQRVCEEASGLAGMTPTVNLHGDAHVEQYAVMSEGRGLMDFDDSARGPALVDLARLGVSVTLAAELNDWESETEALLVEIWRGYADAVREPERAAPVPSVVTRIQGGFSDDRRPFLESAEALMKPRSRPPAEVGHALRFGVSLFETTLRAAYPDRNEGFFVVKRVGRLESGIGSALTEKYLLRLEGETPSADDDLVLEVKHLGALDGADCIRRGRSDPFPVLIAQSQLAYRPYDYVGFLYLDPARAGEGGMGADYWDGSVYIIQSWIDNYVELSVESSFESVEELREIVYDSGAQLGRGHTGELSGALSGLRAPLAAMTEDRYDDYVALVAALSAEWRERWEARRPLERSEH